MIFFNINSFAKHGIEVHMNRLISLVFGMMILSSCSQEKIEMKVELKNVLYNSSGENTLSYSDRSIYPSTGARGTGDGGGIILGKGERKYYSKTVYLRGKSVFILMNGSYTANIQLLRKGRVCAVGNFQNNGPPTQVRLECKI
jgi:hypothetical protein